MDKPGLIYVKPVEGRTVRDHRTRLLVPGEGMFVPAGDPHWMASLAFGDLEECDPPAEPQPETEAEPVANVPALPAPEPVAAEPALAASAT